MHRILYVGPLLIALAALVATLATIAPDRNGPGVTCDELYHVYQGKQLVTALRHQGFDFFLPANIDKNFSWPKKGPPVQAPLGYWILGWTHWLFDPAPDDPLVLSVTTARFAPALAFTMLILLVGVWTARREGPLAGTVAAAAVTLMPRLFGHAHIASLDMLTALFFVAAVLAIAEAARGQRNWQFALAGVVWGAAMLVRLHGLLLLPPVVLWLIWRLRRQAAAPVVSWLAAGGLTFFVGWPWLWLAPISRCLQYLASGTDRQALHVFYLSRVWTDLNVPWHYPWVMFAATLPLGLLVLGLLGFWAVLRTGPMTPLDPTHLPNKGQGILLNPFAQQEGPLLAGTLGFVLLVFSWPGTHVYDGVRLFLMVFPLWAIWVGLGARWLVACSAESDPRSKPASWLSRLWPKGKAGIAAILVFVALQGVGLVAYCPCHLSSYSLLVGGLAGAERLGFEVTYWGDTVREPMLVEAARLSPHRPVLFAPSLAPFQASAINVTSPALRAADTTLVGWNLSAPETAKGVRYAIVYHRRADLGSAMWMLQEGRVVKTYEIQGVWLAKLVEFDAPLDAPARRIRIDGLP